MAVLKLKGQAERPVDPCTQVSLEQLGSKKLSGRRHDGKEDIFSVNFTI